MYVHDLKLRLRTVKLRYEHIFALLFYNLGPVVNFAK